MKAKIILFLFCGIILVVTQSCSTREIFGGPGKTSIVGSASWQDPIGAQAGVALSLVNLNESIDLRVEPGLSLQGAKWEEYDLKGRTNLFYLNCPVVLRYQHESGFFGEAGIQPGLLLSAKDKYEGNTDDYMDHMNKLDLSIPLGAGYMFNDKFGVSLRVIPGINDITKDADDKDRNLVIGLRGIYRFGKK